MYITTTGINITYILPSVLRCDRIKILIHLNNIESKIYLIKARVVFLIILSNLSDHGTFHENSAAMLRKNNVLYNCRLKEKGKGRRKISFLHSN